MKVYINGPGHMFINGKNLISRNKSPVILKLGIQHWDFKICKVCVNDDPEMTLTYFMARSKFVAFVFDLEKLLQSHLMGKTCSKRPN